MDAWFLPKWQTSRPLRVTRVERTSGLPKWQTNATATMC